MQKCAKKLYILEVSYGEEPGTFEHVNTGKIRISGGLRGGVGQWFLGGGGKRGCGGGARSRQEGVVWGRELAA